MTSSSYGGMNYSGGEYHATVYDLTVMLGACGTDQVIHDDLPILCSQIAAAPRMRAVLAALVARIEQAPADATGSPDSIGDILDEARALLAFAGEVGQRKRRAAKSAARPLPRLGSVGRSPRRPPSSSLGHYSGGEVFVTVYDLTLTLGALGTEQVRHDDLPVLGSQIAAAPRMRAVLAALVAGIEQAQAQPPGSLDAISDTLDEARALLAFAGEVGLPKKGGA